MRSLVEGSSIRRFDFGEAEVHPERRRRRRRRAQRLLRMSGQGMLPAAHPEQGLSLAKARIEGPLHQASPGPPPHAFGAGRQDTPLTAALC
jgi:hypothetical protein